MLLPRAEARRSASGSGLATLLSWLLLNYTRLSNRALAGVRLSWRRLGHAARLGRQDWIPLIGVLSPPRRALPGERPFAFANCRYRKRGRDRLLVQAAPRPSSWSAADAVQRTPIAGSKHLAILIWPLCSAAGTEWLTASLHAAPIGALAPFVLSAADLAPFWDCFADATCDALPLG